jgi:hypothetical protein
MSDRERVWHWYETIRALAPLDRFHDLVPVDGVYQPKGKTK